jgi:hypothetical protein
VQWFSSNEGPPNWSLPEKRHFGAGKLIPHRNNAGRAVQTADAPSLQVSRNQLTTCVTKQHFEFKL